MPFLPAPLSVTAKTTAMSAFLPEVMNCFTPFSTYSLPLRSARVVIAEASEPTCGSVSAKAPSIFPCASGFRNLFFLRRIAIPGQDAGDEVVHRDDGRGGAVAGGDFLAGHRERGVVHARAAPFLGDGHAIQAHLGEALRSASRGNSFSRSQRAACGASCSARVAAHRLADLVSLRGHRSGCGG